MELLNLAQVLIAAVEDEAPELPATIGVAIRRASVGGDIEVVNVSVDGGSGDRRGHHGGRFRADRRRVGSRPQSRPPSTGAGAIDGSSAPAQSFSSTQRNVNAGRDIITNVNYAAPAEAGNSGGRIAQ